MAVAAETAAVVEFEATLRIHRNGDDVVCNGCGGRAAIFAAEHTQRVATQHGQAPPPMIPVVTALR